MRRYDGQIHQVTQERIDQHRMNTRNLKDREGRKKLKRAARKKRPAKAKRTDPRGSHKPKVKKKGPGVATRR